MQPMLSGVFLRRFALCLFFVLLFGPFSAEEKDLFEEEYFELIDSRLENPNLIVADSSTGNTSSDINALIRGQRRVASPPKPQSQKTSRKALQQTQVEIPHLYSEPSRTILETAQERGTYLKPDCPTQEGYTINFEDISVIQLIQFISKISGSNFIFNSNDLGTPGPDGKLQPYKISIVSEDPTSVENLSAALLQVLKIHGLAIVEQGNNVLIYRNQTDMSRLSTIITDENINDACHAAIITRVFKLYNVDAEKIRSIIVPLLSTSAIVEVSPETRHLIVTDITANVDKIADLLTALDTPNAAFEVQEYRVKSAYPTALVAYAREILAPLTQDNPLQMIAQPSSSKIYIVSTPYLINKALQVLKSLDTADITEAIVDLPSSSMANNNFYMYKLKYQDGREIADAMREIGYNLSYAGVANPDFLNTIYSVQWLEVNNSIVITGTDDAVQKVVQLLDDLDTAPKQVFIEVLILDTTLTNSLDFGVQWIALGEEQDKLAFASGLLSNSPPSPNLQGGTASNPGARFVAANPAANPPSIPNPGRDVALPVPSSLNGISSLVNSTSAFGLGFIGNILRHNGKSFLTLGALISALDEESQTSIVLNPRIMVEDTQPANFFVGQNIPYQTTSTVIQQTGSVTQNIQYEDIGVQLRVTPTIAPNNVVTMQIDLSDVSLAVPLGSTLTPSTNKTLSTTRVHIPDGCFLVMSGQISDEEDCIYSGVPCLGSLPLIGPTFSRRINTRQKRNLIFFIRPKVITDIQDGIDLTNEQGYEFNWGSNPCSIINCPPEVAPECEVYFSEE